MANINAIGANLSTKGDLISASAAGIPSIRGVGVDGLFLVADSAQASGLNWAASSGAGEIIQVQYNSTASVITCTTQLPWDDTIPQNGEGTEVITDSITPTNASNILKISYWFCGSHRDANTLTVCSALFQDATASAIFAAAQGCVPSSGIRKASEFKSYYMVAGTTSSTTFKLRVGTDGNFSGTSGIYINGSETGVRRFGGVSRAYIEIKEIKV